MSFLVKNSPKLFFRLLPVSSVIPFSNMALTTAASTWPSGMAAGSRTSTTRPGNGPGRLHLVRGTLKASSMLVFGLGLAAGAAGLAGGCWPWAWLLGGQEAAARHDQAGADGAADLEEVAAADGVLGGHRTVRASWSWTCAAP